MLRSRVESRSNCGSTTSYVVHVDGKVLGVEIHRRIYVSSKRGREEAERQAVKARQVGYAAKSLVGKMRNKAANGFGRLSDLCAFPHAEWVE